MGRLMQAHFLDHQSVSFSERDILQSILALVGRERIELDPCYCIGSFYDGLLQPRYKFDLLPRGPGIVQADCRELPLWPETIDSIMFDPPFIAGGMGTMQMIKNYGRHESMPEFFEFLRDSFIEFYRVLKYKGALIVKIQDQVDARYNFFTHIVCADLGYSIGLYPRDLRIYVNPHRIPRVGMKIQQHARKIHSYYWIFEKSRKARYVEKKLPYRIEIKEE